MIGLNEPVSQSREQFPLSKVTQHNRQNSDSLSFDITNTKIEESLEKISPTQKLVNPKFSFITSPDFTVGGEMLPYIEEVSEKVTTYKNEPISSHITTHNDFSESILEKRITDESLENVNYHQRSKTYYQYPQENEEMPIKSGYDSNRKHRISKSQHLNVITEYVSQKKMGLIQQPKTFDIECNSVSGEGVVRAPKSYRLIERSEKQDVSIGKITQNEDQSIENLSYVNSTQGLLKQKSSVSIDKFEAMKNQKQENYLSLRSPVTNYHNDANLNYKLPKSETTYLNFVDVIGN